MRPVAYWATVAETVSYRSVGPVTRIRVGPLFMLGLAAAVMFPSMVMANADADSLSSGVATQPSPAQSGIGTLEEVIVTAQKRDTNLENTPIAVSAFTPDFIDRNRIQSLEDVALRTPSVAFVQINNGEAYISIRGTLVNTPGAGWDDRRSFATSSRGRELCVATIAPAPPGVSVSTRPLRGTKQCKAETNCNNPHIRISKFEC